MVECTILNPWSWGDDFGFVQGVDSAGATRVVHLAGQGDQSNEDGSPSHPGDVAAQTAGALDNVGRVLAAAGLDLSAVTRMNIFTTDVDLFMSTGQPVLVERLRVAGCRASSTLVGVTRLAFPEMLVELEATAVA